MEENYKDQRARGIIQRLASEFIKNESNRKSLITVTDVRTNDDFSNVNIYLTIFPENKEVAAIDFLKRQRSNFREFVKKNSRLARIPRFDFEIDLGEKSRQRIEEIL